MTMDDRDGTIWFDGEFVPWREAKVHVLTYSLHYGVGVFEGVRAYPTDKGLAIFRLDDHTKRLFRSLKILNMKLDFSYDDLMAAQVETVKRNKLKSAYIRPIVYYGSESLGISVKNLKSHACIATWEWGQYLGNDAVEKGINVQVSSFTRHHVNSAMCKAKATGHYINSALALQQALACGYREAILLDPRGYVAEGSGENIFLVQNSEIHTPQLTSCLDGITRHSIIVLAKEFGYPVIERPITRDELYISDEIFFTGTAAEVTPIISVDDRITGDGTPGPITKKLQARYFDCVYGRAEDKLHWLTYLD